jgi:hypothetical protein
MSSSSGNVSGLRDSEKEGEGDVDETVELAADTASEGTCTGDDPPARATSSLGLPSLLTSSVVRSVLVLRLKKEDFLCDPTSVIRSEH